MKSGVYASKGVFVIYIQFYLIYAPCHMCYTPKLSFPMFCIGCLILASGNHLMVKVYTCFCSCSPSHSFQAYVYDIRSSSYLHKLQKFSDTVLSVSFNPATPEVRTFFYIVDIVKCVTFLWWNSHWVADWSLFIQVYNALLVL